MKFNCNDDNLILWFKELEEFFLNYKQMSTKAINKLNTLGIRVERRNNHCKLYFKIYDKEKFMIISSTPSDKNVGRQILRQIRRMFKEERR